MISRAIEAGVPFAWFTADEAYGQAKGGGLAGGTRGRYVRGRRQRHPHRQWASARADALIAASPAHSWQKISAAAGAHGPPRVPLGAGPRCALRLGTRPGGLVCWPAAPSPRPGEISYYACYGPPPLQHRRPGPGRGKWLAHRDWPPLAPVKSWCFLTALLLCRRVRVRAAPSGRGRSSRAGVPCARVAAASAGRRR